MRNRCSNPRNKSYADYGGRGIVVCDEWMNDFEKFRDWSNEHGYSNGLSIDRMNNSKGYSPKNCRWTTREEQNNNTSANVFIDYEGKKMTFAQLGKKFSINPHTLRSRLYVQHLPVEIAVSLPVGPDNRHKKEKAS